MLRLLTGTVSHCKGSFIPSP
uniref:Uncharacterized protein n=1 Tax=Arundo donax TaxID=35708 RepID=A0A0A9C2W8_ARUDO